MSCDHVRGTVVIDGTTTAMAGARVVLGVARGGGFDGALTCVSDALGGFSFDLRQLPSGRTSLYHDIRVFDADDVQLEIHGDVRWPRGQDPGPLRLCATPASDCPPPDESLPQDMPPSTGVWGVVRHKDGSPIIATVELWDTSASGETLVGTTTSAGDGWYAIPVAVGTAAVVKAKHTGTSALLAISPAHFSPGPNPLRIDLDVCSDEFRRSTEWSRIEAAGNPVLSPLTADQATMRQLAFISGSTGWAFNQVATWSLAHRLALTLSADAESLYGLLRMGFPRTTQGMAAKPASTVGPALSKAVLRNIIAASKADAANVASVTSALRSALQTQLNSTRDTSIGEILRASGVLSPSQISDFIDAWVAHIGDEPTFWADLPTTKPTSFGGAGGPAAVAEAQRLLTLGAIALSFAPIVEQILAVILSSPASAVASLTSAQWAAIVAGLASLPAGLPDTVPDQAAYLAELLAEHAERFFPSETAREQLVVGIGTGHVLEPAKDFLTANPSFRIADSRVDSFSGTAGEKAAAKRAQRLYRVAPGVGRAAAITTLAEQGFDSAQSVAAMTKGRFLELQEARAAASKSALDLETATQVVRNAQWLQSLSTSLYMAGHAAESGDYAFGPEAASPPSTGTDPDWAGVYASGADCSCEQCRSVHGPAAYLFDLLYWLEVRPVSHPADPDAPDSLLDRLTERRPDLVEIKLNCENAETPLPYVDLVLEALESAVANGGDVGADAGNQTTMDAADLLAAPEHRNEDAYTTSGASKKLDEDTAAISLPFHRPLEEARAFLQHIQASRLAILAAYEDLPSIDVDDLAEEALGLFAERVATITTGVSGTEGDFWPVATASLTNVTTFLRASGLSWPETLNVLHARYANPRTWDGAVWTYDLMVAATDPCDLSTFTIVQTSGGAAPTDNQWTRVRQFVRLLAATGWTPRRLDLVLHAIDDSYAGEWLDTAANWLRPIADVHLLAAETGMAAEVIATTSASAIDTYPDLDGQPSLYETVFLSPAVLGVDDPARASFALNAQGTEIAVSVALSAVQEAVAGALGVNQEELQRLVDAVLPVSAGLTIANLTTLYAWVQIGRLTGLSPTDAVAFSDLASLNPRSVGAGLADLRDLRSLANRLSAAGWSVSELRYVLTSTVVPEAAPTGAFLQQTLGRIRDAATKATTHLTEDSTEASARQAALEAAADALGLPPEALARTRSHTWSGLPTLAVNTSFHVVEQGELTISAESTAAPAGTSILVPIGTSVAPKGGGSAASLGESRPMTMQASATASVTALVLPPGTPWTVSASGADQVDAGTAVEASQVELPAGTPVADQEDGTEWTLTSATTVQVLTPRLAFTTSAAHEGTIAFASSPPNPDFVRRFLRDEFVGSAGPVDDPYGDLIDGGVFADDFSWVRALYKVSLIASKLDLEASEWRWWLDETASASWDLALASGTSGSSAPSYSFAQLVRLFDLFGLQADLRDGEPSFASILELGSAIPGGGSAEVDAFAAALAERSGWPADQITSVAGQTGSSPVDVPGLEALFDRMGLVRRTGVSPAALLGWAVPATDVTSSMSAAVVDAARGRHAGEESWRSAARPVRDVLRKRQRDALVAWLMAHPPTGVTFDTPDDLYEHYLIDVSMNPELLTSRIVQASATVQLFIHRLMLGLERESPSGAMIFEPNGEDREQWEWVRTYRVWEAGRKVFLYPENWIEPELRDDKTPFFRKLEQELSEGDITEERVEKVAIGYLERLSDVANIEVLAFHHQVEALDAVGGDDIDVLHVVGRTRATPSTYWYRRLENDSRWTPWEEVDCGVEGQHLVLTTAGRHVTLVWAVIEEAADLSNAGTALQARVYVSERRNGAWTPPRVSPPVPAGDVEAATRLTVYQASGGSGPRVRIEQDLDACLVGADGGPLYPDGYESGCGAVDVRAELYLDACTGMFAPASPPATLLPRRDAGVGLGWSASQYWFDIANRALSVYDPDVAPATEALTVWWQEAEDGMPKDGAVRLPAPLLATAGMAGVVVPSWTHDFVSQSSFFTQQPGRSWFVRVESTGNLPPAGDHAVSQVMSLSRGVYAPGDPENNNPEPIEDLAPLTHDYLRLDSDLVVSGMTDWLGRFDMLNAGDQPAAPPALYRFSIFYHPLCCAFTDAVNRGGIFALLDPVPSGPETRLASGSLRRQAAIGTFDFETNLTPNPVLTEYSRAIEDIDFSEDGAYSQYNWELFFHMPIFVARRLSDGGHHDQAMKFLHAVFDPRVGDDDVPSASPWTGPARWWKVAPLMQAVSKPVTDWIEFVGGDADAMAAFDRQVDAWREDPFNPHLIARLRPGTYQRAVVMQYVDNLIAWGDALFGQDTLETLNEATQLYVFALQVLGQRPERPKSSAPAAAKTFAEAQSDAVVDRFRNVVFENSYTGEVSAPVGGSAVVTLNGSVAFPYFCVPRNPELQSYWDTLEDRLFKIRNGMNIDGVVRSLPLFQPPIDPAQLVRAAAAGLDISSVVAGLTAPRPRHRFAALLARAQLRKGFALEP